MEYIYSIAKEWTTPDRRVVSDNFGFLYIERVCDACEGTGVMHCDEGVDGFQRLVKCQCDECCGEGVIREQSCPDEL